MTNQSNESSVAPSRVWSLGLAMLLIASARPLSSQQVTCSQVANVILSNTTNRDSLLKASTNIVRCPDQAPRVIATALRRAAEGSFRDSLAQADARVVLDARLADSVIAMAKDAHQSVARRNYFLSLLTRYYNPKLALTASDLGSAAPVVLLPVLHPGTVVGQSPITGSSKERILKAIQWMGANDADEKIRKLASLVAQQITAY